MNTGQMLLTLGAVVLLSVLILRVNSTSLSVQGSHVNSKLAIVAISIANSYIDFAKSKAFDAVILDTTKTNILLSDLTYPLGKESGEVYPNFDDFDDFNMSPSEFIIDTTTLVHPLDPSAYTPFYINSTVYYVSPSDLNTPTTTRQWNKRMNVKVWADGMEDTVRITTVTGYW